MTVVGIVGTAGIGTLGLNTADDTAAPNHPTEANTPAMIEEERDTRKAASLGRIVNLNIEKMMTINIVTEIESIAKKADPTEIGKIEGTIEEKIEKQTISKRMSSDQKHLAALKARKITTQSKGCITFIWLKLNILSN